MMTPFIVLLLFSNHSVMTRSKKETLYLSNPRAGYRRSVSGEIAPTKLDSTQRVDVPSKTTAADMVVEMLRSQPSRRIAEIIVTFESDGQPDELVTLKPETEYYTSEQAITAIQGQIASRSIGGIIVSPNHVNLSFLH